MRELDAAVRDYLAWQHVHDHAENGLNLTHAQKEQAKTRRDREDETVRDRLLDTYSWLLVPEQPDSAAPLERAKRDKDLGPIRSLLSKWRHVLQAERAESGITLRLAEKVELIERTGQNPDAVPIDDVLDQHPPGDPGRFRLSKPSISPSNASIRAAVAGVTRDETVHLFVHFRLYPNRLSFSHW